MLVVLIWQIMASDDGDEDVEGADAADDGCEGARARCRGTGIELSVAVEVDVEKESGNTEVEV